MFNGVKNTYLITYSIKKDNLVIAIELYIDGTLDLKIA